MMRFFIEIEVDRRDIPAAATMFSDMRKFVEGLRIRNASTLIPELVQRVANPEEAESATIDLIRILEASTNEEEVFTILTNAFAEHALAYNLAPGGKTLPFFQLLIALPEPFRGRLRNDIVSKIIQYMNLPRPENFNRGELMTYADGFATLVKLEFVKLAAAISTINTLLKDPEKRCSAITMLGKTVEMCSTLIRDKCDPVPLTELRGLLQDPELTGAFSYDVEYVETTLGWTRQTFAPPNGLPAHTNAFTSPISPSSPNQYANNQVFTPTITPFIPSASFGPPMTSFVAPVSNPPTSYPPYPTAAPTLKPVGNNINNPVIPQPATSHLNGTPYPSNQSTPLASSASQPSIPPAIPASNMRMSSSSHAINPSAPPFVPLSMQNGNGIPSNFSQKSDYGASAPGGSSTSSSASNKNDILTLLERHKGHTNNIFALAYDGSNFISTGKDGAIIVWGRDGKTKERLTIPRYTACALDVNPRFKSLYICGAPKDASTNSPALIRYAVNSRGFWEITGVAEKRSCRVVSSTKALRSEKETFITGESEKIHEKSGFIRLYERKEGQAFESITPLQSYEEHKDIVTCLAPHPTEPEWFFSGSRDQTIKLWDRRNKKSVGALGVLVDGGRVSAHDGMITCMDPRGHLLDSNTQQVSGGLDKVVAVWDIRTLGNNNNNSTLIQATNKWPIDQHALLKLSIGPHNNSCAVSTLRGLYLLDLVNGKVKPSNIQAYSPELQKVGRYHDMVWNGQQLYAVGDDCTFDVYSLE